MQSVKALCTSRRSSCSLTCTAVGAQARADAWRHCRRAGAANERTASIFDQRGNQNAIARFSSLERGRERVVVEKSSSAAGRILYSLGAASGVGFSFSGARQRQRPACSSLGLHASDTSVQFSGQISFSRQLYNYGFLMKEPWDVMEVRQKAQKNKLPQLRQRLPTSFLLNRPPA